ncbi:MAG: hypothetical protein J7500_09050 [Sphingomonas sp.]|uniref:hypothetical protein n=1 Tax=Sphingomonas sp. TaxID=28214 RepID=UPI001B08439D|nr:hypothetical protein [Sphingomonas sp.]MBO9622846.1 hypothetical protein [Sphingomonas sp.]
MGIFDGLLGQLGGVSDVVNLAEKIGLDPKQVEGAIGALAKAHPEPGDTAQSAAASTGLPLDKINDIIGHIGGEGSLGQFAQLIQGQSAGVLGGLGSMLDRNHDGSVIDDIGGLAGGLLGKK